MKSPLSIFCRLYLPFIVATVLICASYNSRADQQGSRLSVLPMGGIISFDIPIKSHTVTELTAWILCVVILSTYLFIDYTSIFPRHLRMEVFYDTTGVERAVQKLGNLGDNMRIAPNANQLRSRYYEQLNRDIQSVTSVTDFFGKADITLHSHGQTSFIVEKCPGLQKYRLSESSGELIHSLELPRQPVMRLTTLFEHLSSGSDHLDVRMIDLLIGRGVLLRPCFKQILAEERGTREVIYRNIIVGVTRVHIFPWPSISHTVYLADLGEGDFVPLGYAVYVQWN